MVFVWGFIMLTDGRLFHILGR